MPSEFENWLYIVFLALVCVKGSKANAAAPPQARSRYTQVWFDFRRRRRIAIAAAGAPAAAGVATSNRHRFCRCSCYYRFLVREKLLLTRAPYPVGTARRRCDVLALVTDILGIWAVALLL